MLIYTRKGCKWGSCVPQPGSEDALPDAVRAMVAAIVEERKAAAKERADKREELRVRAACASIHCNTQGAKVPAHLCNA